MTVEPTTWQEIIRELRSHGYTYERIAIECQLVGVEYSPAAVQHLALGRRLHPYYAPGKAIMDLYARTCITTYRSE